MNRRQFVKRVGLAAAALGATRIAEAAAPDKQGAIPIVDTHQHLWDLGKFKLPWIKEGSPLARSFVTADYLKATEGLPSSLQIWLYC